VEDFAKFALTAAAPKWSCLVNRVSDAAPPSEFKSCLAAIAFAHLHDIPVINGANCFSIGANKYMHHAILNAVGCRTPRSVVVQPGCKYLELAKQLTFPLILKPNAGGFG